MPKAIFVKIGFEIGGLIFSYA